jgi:hypothetical protein
MNYHYQQARYSGNDDEQQLAKLILLLRLPHSSPSAANDANDSNIVDDGPAAAALDAAAAATTTTTTALRSALERDDFELLRFMERLVWQYENDNKAAAAVEAAVEGSGISNANYAFLRLAVRIAYLRYAFPSSSRLIGSSNFHDDDGDNKAQANVDKEELNNVESDGRGVWECELRLLNSLLRVFHGRRNIIDDTLAIEASWAVEGLLVKLSSLSSNFIHSPSTKVPWNKAIRTLLQYRREEQWRGESGGADEEEQISSSSSSNVEDKSAVHPSPSQQMKDEQTMIQTIHSILDRYGSSLTDGTPDWELQFDASLLACLNSFLNWCENYVEQGHKVQKLTQDILLGLIHRSQERHPLSLAIYVLVNKYLRLCQNDGNDDDRCSDDPPPQRSLNCFQHSFVREDTYQNESLRDETKVEFAVAMRSFLFYGLIVLCNTERKSFLKTFITNVSSHHTSAMIIRRGEVFSLLLNMWRCFGVDWLFISQSKVADFWWFPSGESETEDTRSFGPTWPLCMLIRLAAGEFRLGLGRYLSEIEDGGVQNLDEKDRECLVVDIVVCSQVVSQTRHLVTSLVDDEDGVAFVTPWSPDAVLHIRTSLEDALNSSMQYITIFSGDCNSTKYHPLAEDDVVSPLDVEIWHACCLITGSIADELDVDQLLVLSSAESIVSNHCSLGGESNVPPIVLALRSGIEFSNSLAERRCLRNLNCQESLELEPLVYLLPSMMSLVSRLAFGDDDEVASNMAESLQLAKKAFNADDWLMLTISKFLRRLSDQWSEYCQRRVNIRSIDSLVVRRTNSVVSVVDMCLVIISSLGYITTSTRKVNYAALSKRVGINVVFDRWKHNLKAIGEWPSEELRCSSAETLDKVSLLLNCCQ